MIPVINFNIITYVVFFHLINKRSSADATNPRDAFRGQSRSPNMVPFDVKYGFVY